VTNRGTNFLNLLEVENGFQVFDGMTNYLPRKYTDFVFRSRVADLDTHEKAVELCFWQREGPIQLDGVLGRENHERLLESVRIAVDGHLALLHTFEKSGLRTRRRAVNFVCEQYVSKHRSGVEFEFVTLRMKNGDPGNVRRKEVRCELNTPKVRPEGLRECSREQRFADAGHVFYEQVSPGEEAGHRQLQDGVLTDDDAFQISEKAFGLRIQGSRVCSDLGLNQSLAAPRYKVLGLERQLIGH